MWGRRALFLLVLALFGGLLNRTYYAFYFLPSRDVGFFEIFVFEEWKEYVTSPIGLILTVLTFAPLILAGLFIWIDSRKTESDLARM